MVERGIWTSSIQRCFSVVELEEEEQQGDHTLQYADASNTELLHRTIHSAHQLSIYGAVARWCEDSGMKSDETLPKTINAKILKEVQPKEVTSSVKVPRNAQPSGNSLREAQQNFETLVTEVKITRICQEVAFIHEVAVGRFYRTALDVDDDFGDRTLCVQGAYESSCRV